MYQASDGRGTPGECSVFQCVLLSSASTEGQARTRQACCFFTEAGLMRLVHSLNPFRMMPCLPGAEAWLHLPVAGTDASAPQHKW